MNSLIVSNNTSAKAHNHIVREIDQILEDEAARAHLSWDPEKETRLDYKRTTRIKSLVKLQARYPVGN